jgi:predicted Rossmann fold nucleotide-binding protein DprA/Smf involved in DNA uptake
MLMAVTDLSPNTHGLLRLTMVPGLGPVLISRLLREMGSAEAVLRASPSALRSVRGIGDAQGEADRGCAPESGSALPMRRRGVAADAGVRLIGLGDAEYPVLLLSY